MELLLVAGILAVIAAFALPKLLDKAQQAKEDIARAAIGRNGSIAKGLESYQWDMGRFPETDEGLAALFAPKGSRSDEKYKGPYMTGTLEELKDPWGNPYEYRCPGQFNETEYDLWSRGRDGNDDGGKAGSDDLKNWLEK
jgi:general secretion pathway protein G